MTDTQPTALHQRRIASMKQFILNYKLEWYETGFKAGLRRGFIFGFCCALLCCLAWVWWAG